MCSLCPVRVISTCVGSSAYSESFINVSSSSRFQLGKASHIDKYSLCEVALETLLLGSFNQPGQGFSLRGGEEV